jgi:5-methylcytosine-specific restriction endonuclease McrA
MRIELWILLITAFLVYNAYNDGKYTKMIMSYKKYYTMGFYCILGLGIYLLFKRNPEQGKNMLQTAHNAVKYMPIDKSSLEMFTPLFDFTSNSNGYSNGNENGNSNSFMESLYGVESGQQHSLHSQQRMMQSGKGASKRSVSETKKKYVAANQEWKCGHCQSQLDHTFEIDHKIRLEYGGGNDVQNLIALCRNCHGKKTASENM